MVSSASHAPPWLRSHWLWLALLALAFAPTAAWLFDRWTVSIWYNGHGIFIPFIVAYLVRDHFLRDPLRDEQSSPLGFLFLAAGLGMLAMDSVLRTHLLGAAGLIVCLPGIALLLLGTRRTKSLVFPLILTLFMLPIPQGPIRALYLVLREISAFGSAHLVQVLGIPVLRDQTTLYLPSVTVEVADACSGFSTLYAAVTLGLILAFLSQSAQRRALLLTSAVVLAIVCNVIRVAILTLIVHAYGVDPLKTPLHEVSGMITFSIVLVGLFMIAERPSLRAGSG
jgi:exosortase